MIESIKRMVLTGAAVAVMSLAAPAMAAPKVVDGGPGVIGPVVDPPDPPDPDPLCDVRPYGCGNNPDPVLDPGEDPVADPPTRKTPLPILPARKTLWPTPARKTPSKIPTRTTPATNGPPLAGLEAAPAVSSGGGAGSASETIDHGGTFVSGLLPTALTNAISDAGNSMKKNLPARVAESLPNTGSGWSLLVLIAAGLIAGGLVIRSTMRRTTSVTRTAQ